MDTFPPCCGLSASTYAGFVISLTGAVFPPLRLPCPEYQGASGALLFLSAMVGEDPTEDKSSKLPRGEPDGLWLMFGGAKDEWRLENVSGHSDGTLERLVSEVSGEGHS